jgi:hypothetical protein
VNLNLGYESCWSSRFSIDPASCVPLKAECLSSIVAAAVDALVIVTFMDIETERAPDVPVRIAVYTPATAELLAVRVKML